MKSKTKKLVVAAGALFFFAGCYSGWSRYSASYSRFPLYRLPHWSCFDSWRFSRTNSDLAAIDSALQRFHAHYRGLPLNNPQRDEQFSTTLGHDLNGLLTDIDRRNSHQVVFWNVPAWEQRDGWGHSYHYHFDHNSDGMVDTEHRKVSCSYFVWSDGPDRVNQGGMGDDISVLRTIKSP